MFSSDSKKKEEKWFFCFRWSMKPFQTTNIQHLHSLQTCSHHLLLFHISYFESVDTRRRRHYRQRHHHGLCAKPRNNCIEKQCFSNGVFRHQAHCIATVFFFFYVVSILPNLRETEQWTFKIEHLIEFNSVQFIPKWN